MRYTRFRTSKHPQTLIVAHCRKTKSQAASESESEREQQNMLTTALLLVASASLAAAEYNCSLVPGGLSEWCTRNCNHDPSYCPLPVCAACFATSAPPPTVDDDDDSSVTVTCEGIQFSAWCEANCNHIPPFCPMSFCGGCNNAEEAPGFVADTSKPECAVFTDFWCQASCTHSPPSCPDCCIRSSQESPSPTSSPSASPSASLLTQTEPADLAIDCDGNTYAYGELPSDMRDTCNPAFDCAQTFWSSLGCFNENACVSNDPEVFLLPNCDRVCTDIAPALFIDIAEVCSPGFTSCTSPVFVPFGGTCSGPDASPEGPCNAGEVVACDGTCATIERGGQDLGFGSTPECSTRVASLFNCSKFYWGFGQC